MSGVEILATEEVATSFGFCWLGFLLVVILGGCAVIMIGVGAWNKDSKDVGIPVICGTLPVVLLMALFAGFAGNGEPTKYETRYKVTISDEVSMNEFLERYEIIDQEGKIYTVRETHGINK